MRLDIRALLIAVTLVVPFGGMAEAQSAGADAQRLLTVGGEGIVRAQPDMALITLGVVSEAPDARTALAANSESMNRILAALKEDGMESRDLQTSGFSVNPVYSQPPRDYDPSRPFQPKIVGYSVSNNLTLRIRDLTKVGVLLDKAVTLGANSIAGPSFTVADPGPLEDQARRAAIRDAVRKATLYAEAAEIGLGDIFRIDEGYMQPPQPIAAGAMTRMEAAADMPVPIEGGELTFQAQVMVSWTLAD